MQGVTENNVAQNTVIFVHASVVIAATSWICSSTESKDHEVQRGWLQV